MHDVAGRHVVACRGSGCKNERQCICKPVQKRMRFAAHRGAGKPMPGTRGCLWGQQLPGQQPPALPVL
eukprot:scaffold126112_cov17-Tisochrysis_lutea.AAC.3